MREVTRRKALSTTALVVAGASVTSMSVAEASPIGMRFSKDELEHTKTFLDSHVCIDVHSHPGRSFMVGFEIAEDLAQVIEPGGFEMQRVAGMQTHGVDATLSAIVSDLRVLGFKGRGIVSTRQFAPGEAYADFLRQLRYLQALVEDPALLQAATVAEIHRAHDLHRPAFMLAVEGGDFIENKLNRIQAAREAGIRVISPVHYHVNALGDIQTAPPLHGGLTSLGAEAITAMNEHGILVDASHASEPTVRGILDVSNKPVILSHSHISGAIASPRFVSLELARRIANDGGVIGAWPAGIGATTLADFVDRILELVDAVGAEHVAIGTDLDANYQPILTKYADFVPLTAGLKRKGLNDVQLAGILGENFLRVLAANETGVLTQHSPLWN